MSADSGEKQRRMHPNSLAMLERYRAPSFQPGVSGNPGGVRKGTVFPTEAYKRLGAMDVEELRGYRPKNGIEAAAKATILRAVEAKDWKAADSAAKELADRIEGKPKQIVGSVDLTAVEKERAKFQAAILGLIEQTGCEYEQACQALLTINPHYGRFLE